jgi:hypothetical protein
MKDKPNKPTVEELRSLSEQFGFPFFIDKRPNDAWSPEDINKLVRPEYSRPSFAGGSANPKPK